MPDYQDFHLRATEVIERLRALTAGIIPANVPAEDFTAEVNALVKAITDKDLQMRDILAGQPLGETNVREYRDIWHAISVRAVESLRESAGGNAAAAANARRAEEAVMAFPTPLGDVAGAAAHAPMSVATNGDERVYSFAKPVTVRALTLPGLRSWMHDKYCYHVPWLRVTLEAKTPGGWREVANSQLPVSCWRDYVQTLTISCDEATSDTWRYRIYRDFPLPAGARLGRRNLRTRRESRLASSARLGCG